MRFQTQQLRNLKCLEYIGLVF